MNSIDLNLSVTPFDASLYVPDDADINQHWLIEKQTLSSGLVELVNGLGLEIGTSSYLFYTPPNGHLGIHIDGDHLHNKCMLNFVWGSNNHLMNWYNLDPSFKLETRSFTNSESYISVPSEMAFKINDAIIKYPSLTRVGIPHSVENYGTTGRWCLSVDIRETNDTMPGVDFDKAQIYFKDYLI